MCACISQGQDEPQEHHVDVPMFHATHYTRSYFYTMYTLIVSCGIYGILLMGDPTWTICPCGSYFLFSRFRYFDVKIPMLFSSICGGHILGGRLAFYFYFTHCMAIQITAFRARKLIWWSHSASGAYVFSRCYVCYLLYHVTINHLPDNTHDAHRSRNRNIRSN